MKKLLLSFIAFAFALSMNAQIFWQENATGFSSVSRGINQISYADANNVWCTAYDGVTVTNVIREFTKSTDGGATWTAGVINLGVTTLGLACISGISDTTAFVGAFPDTGGTGGVWKTTDSGATWTRQASASFNSATSFTDIVQFWDANNGIAIGDPDTPTTFEVYTTSNGGTNWVRLPAGNIPVPLDGEYAYTRGFCVNGDNMWFGTNKGRLYRSTDRGQNWTVAVSPIADFQTGNYAFQSATEGLLIADDFQFWRTTDGGATWNPEVPTGVFRNAALCYVPGTVNTYVSLGDDPDLGERGSSYSTDGGLNWIDINTLGDDANVDNTTDVQFFDNTNGLASGFNASVAAGGIFKYVGTQLSLATATFSNDKGFTAFINASTGMLEVNGKNITNVAVYDVLGKLVSNGNFTSVDNASINAANLNAGIYLVKVTNNAGASSTVKVVKN
ncbi:T9SS type A sorting domain-containing protein [Flavobacterium sp.]|uniref:T9SS type A sorting domain-containing protein n=1 Tax=Flavobacterium sp. TaxID=239 RepID=UPI00286AD04D|nr:T9SS type A sorting domain-containing protein [Flavobacterium sp.]